MYLARRRISLTRRPLSRAARFLGKGKRRSGRCVSTFSIRAPKRALARPRQTVSTSGNSGIEALYLSGRARARIEAMSAKRKTSPDANPESEWFGFRRVRPEDKTGLVREVFASVAENYD